MRGNAVRQVAKRIILTVEIGTTLTKYVRGVVPGDARVDVHAIKSLVQGTYVSFASPHIAEKLAAALPARLCRSLSAQCLSEPPILHF